MGSSPAVSAAFAAAFAERAGPGGALAFDAFMDLALYHPALGYYRRDRRRVGYGPDTDFYTASTSGAVFGELVCAACTALLGGESAAREHVFVEIGAEPDGGVLKDVVHPFAGSRIVRIGDEIEIGGRCVVFSNELFDARPIRRFVRRGGEWVESGVILRDGSLLETELSPVNAPWLPESAPEGYRFDAPRAAADLAAGIAAQPWTGLFVAFDYGKSFEELASAVPGGTVRAYSRHTQSNRLLDDPGEQDLTGHVCWDWLASALDGAGFASATVESQESFFVRRAGDYLARTLAAEAARPSQRKLALMQLLHPSHLGQKFQVLHARR